MLIRLWIKGRRSSMIHGAFCRLSQYCCRIWIFKRVL